MATGEAKLSSPPTNVSISLTLRRVRLFRDWPSQHIAEVLRVTRLLHVPAGHLLLAQGHAPSGIYVIAAGSMEVASMHADGRRFVRRYAGPGMLFGLISVLDGNGSPYTYTAQTLTTIALVPKDAFLEVLSRHPETWSSVARFVATFQRIALSTIDEHMFVPLETRVARTLLSLADGQVNQGHLKRVRAVTITQENIASLLGVSRQSISKQLKRLEQRGRIRIAYGQIELLDYDAIQQLAMQGGATDNLRVA